MKYKKKDIKESSMINQLVNNIKKLDAPIVVGLDPMLDYVQNILRKQHLLNMVRL